MVHSIETVGLFMQAEHGGSIQAGLFVVNAVNADVEARVIDQPNLLVIRSIGVTVKNDDLHRPIRSHSVDDAAILVDHDTYRLFVGSQRISERSGRAIDVGHGFMKLVLGQAGGPVLHLVDDSSNDIGQQEGGFCGLGVLHGQLEGGGCGARPALARE
jgi:hypothetical protein